MDELSLTAVGLGALTQGVAFLYSQAGELLRIRRSTRERRSEQIAPTELPPLNPPETAFNPSAISARPVPRGDILDTVGPELEQLRATLAPYATPGASIDRSPETLAAVDELRSLVERIYDTTLTFRSEVGHEPGRAMRIKIDSHPQNGGVKAKKIKAKYVAGKNINFNKK